MLIYIEELDQDIEELVGLEEETKFLIKMF